MSVGGRRHEDVATPLDGWREATRGRTVTDNMRFGELIDEFRRVGVDPDTFTAVLAVTPDEALRALRALPDGAGPEAFLHRLRSEREHRGIHGDHAAAPDDVRHSA